MEINSDAQENIDWLNSLYDATEPLAIAQDDVEEYSIKLNDMRSIIEETMETLFTYDGLYNDINQTFLEAKNYCDEITVLHNNINASIIEGEKLTNETRGFILDFQNNVQVRVDGTEFESISTIFAYRFSFSLSIHHLSARYIKFLFNFAHLIDT